MTPAAAPSGFSLRVDAGPADRLVVSLSGRVSLDDADRLAAGIQAILSGRRAIAVTFDLGGVSYMDSAGVLALMRSRDRFVKRGIPVETVAIPDEVQGIMQLIDVEALDRPPLREPPKPVGPVEALGAVGIGILRDGVALLTFLGDLVAALWYLTLHPRAIRWGDVLATTRRAGADGLPIVALISSLIGLIIAFMSSLQLTQFGANLYVASLVAVAIVRELGPIMTAILVAGRSASAYAAEIGTMRINSEVDALVTMGFDPIRFLVAPKLIATVLVLPILTLYADLFGILGGMVVGIVGLDITAYTWLQTSRRSITVFFLLASLVKAVVFAAVIAWVGCQRGLQVHGGVEAVGEATTSAVVTSILMIVIVDSAFAVVLHYLR
jgi:phospholipid/cholesterol/gamma-HCH transport system permease protein